MQELIPPITDNSSLAEVAEAFAEATQSARRLESSRKNLTVSITESLRKINQTTKDLKGPHQQVIDATEKALSDWRISPEVQTHYAELRQLERKLHAAQTEGDEKAMELVGTHLNELTAELPKSLPVSNGSIRFRENLIIDEVDMLTVDPSLTLVVPDKKAIEARIEAIGAAEGVRFHYEYGAAYYADKE